MFRREKGASGSDLTLKGDALFGVVKDLLHYAHAGRQAKVKGPEKKTTQVHATDRRIYCEDNIPGEPGFQPGDRFWTTRERVGFSTKGVPVPHSLSLRPDASRACAPDRRRHLTDRVFSFRVSWNRPGHPLELEQQFAEGGAEIGGNNRILPSSP